MLFCMSASYCKLDSYRAYSLPLWLVPLAEQDCHTVPEDLMSVLFCGRSYVKCFSFLCDVLSSLSSVFKYKYWLYRVNDEARSMKIQLMYYNIYTSFICYVIFSVHKLRTVLKNERHSSATFLTWTTRNSQKKKSKVVRERRARNIIDWSLILNQPTKIQARALKSVILWILCQFCS